MDLIKMLWPFACKVKEKDVNSLVVHLVVLLVVCFLIGIGLFLLAFIPFIGILTALLGGLVGLYSFVDIVLSILCFLGMLK
ncbi:MAG: hypothetical protein E7527_03800 [Ruminococcaceae bacterium]|nr:hypothetical protein [Oscillospiraceae bacterium]